MSKIIWYNGAFKENIAVFSASDRGFRGHGVFDTLLAQGGRPVYAEEHFTRLKEHAAIMGLEIVPAYKLVDIAAALLEKNHLQNAVIRTVVTGGAGAGGLRTPSGLQPEIVMHAAAYTPDNTLLSAIIAHSVRRGEYSPLSRIKSLNYGDHILAMQEAQRAGAQEAILLNTQGHAACFTAGNLFLLKKNRLYTPPLSDGVMDGIIRRKWMQRADITEKSLSLADLEGADALYLTNSLRGIVPVAALDGKTLPAGDFAFDKTIHNMSS